MLKIMKSAVRSITPEAVLAFRRAYIDSRREKALAAASGTREIFSAVYRNGMWGGTRAKFYSGPGSHESIFVSTYVDAIRSFLKGMPKSPSVVDLGCGDFNIGNQLRDLCGTYIACDIVPALIERNRRTFANRDVNFRCLDITSDPLPDGDIVFIRQVLQHLSNDAIGAVLPKLSKFRCAVISEVCPAGPFEPNADHITGPATRLDRQSGVVVSAPPFNLSSIRRETLCEIGFDGFLLRTEAHYFRR